MLESIQQEMESCVYVRKIGVARLCGPLETPVNAAYGVIRESNTAIMEMAAAAGIILVGKDKRPLDATTYGVGEMIRDAITRGCREFIIGIGGSATNDGGIGMLTALGYEFLDAEGKPAGIGAGALYKVAKICDDKVMPELKDCHFRIACDVTNPLCGENGSTYIYGPQKGVTVELRDELDHAMGAYAQVVKAYNGTDYAKTPGAGAAGGLGFAFLSFLSGELLPGIELVLNAVEMDKAMEGADLVFTGEGRLDYQTAMGKAPVGIAKMAKKHGAFASKRFPSASIFKAAPLRPSPCTEAICPNNSFKVAPSIVSTHKAFSKGAISYTVPKVISPSGIAFRIPPIFMTATSAGLPIARTAA